MDEQEKIKKFAKFESPKGGWNEKEVGMWLEEATDTLRRLPGGSVKNRVTFWPDVVQTSIYSFDYGKGKPRLAAPMPTAIDRMERVLGWLLTCEQEPRKLAWARACGIPWRRLEDIDGRSHVTLRKIVNQAYCDILYHLRTGEKPGSKRLGRRKNKENPNDEK